MQSENNPSGTDIDFISNSCYVLGCAGGGATAASRLQLRAVLRRRHSLRIIDASALSKDALVYEGRPGALGYDLEYKALGEYVEPKSVVAKYSK